MALTQTINKIKKEIPANVKILAATKTRTTAEIQEAVDSGISIIGENYVQEAEKKYPYIKGDIEKHCIGHLQKNKIKKALEIFDVIETVDSLDIAKEIDKRTKKQIPTYIEVNIGKETKKTGVLPENLEILIEEISKLKNVKITGLMTMAPFFEDIEKIRPYFKEMKRLFDKIHKKYPSIAILSMGMSDSYKIAIEEGANLIRLGTAIFGRRS